MEPVARELDFVTAHSQEDDDYEPSVDCSDDDMSLGSDEQVSDNDEPMSDSYDDDKEAELAALLEDREERFLTDKNVDALCKRCLKLMLDSLRTEIDGAVPYPTSIDLRMELKSFIYESLLKRYEPKGLETPSHLEEVEL